MAVLGPYEKGANAMPLIFCDESDTVKVVHRDVFVYACLRLRYATYDVLESRFIELKRAKGMTHRHELKWATDRTFRSDFLCLLADHRAEIFYYVVTDKRNFSRTERYHRKAVEAAFRSVCSDQHPFSLLLLDTRGSRQDREEATVLMYLEKAQGRTVPAYAFLPSERVVGLQLADLVAGAVRTYKADGEERYYTIIRHLVREQIEVTRK